MKHIEILAPAGSQEAFFSAIHHGADAIYMGGKQFGARAYAPNFTNEEITHMIKTAHHFDVKVYVTVNTLIKDDEFDAALDFVRFLYESDCDAVIMQDIGLIDVCRQMYPDLSIHASTQLNVHTVEEALLLKRLGVRRIVLAREVPLSLVREIINQTHMEIEVFAHGALCMSYSGQCHFSSVIGRRSGNRGRCAQPCRLPYRYQNEKNPAYHLSTKDLMTIDDIDQLIKAGITSIKIEGRMKRAEYVGLAVRSYKNAIEKIDDPHAKDQLALMFNRDFTKGFLFEADNQTFTNIHSPNHIGIDIGEVIQSDAKQTTIQLTYPLHLEDGIRFVGEIEDAITIKQMFKNKKSIVEAQASDCVQVFPNRKLMVGTRVLKTSDNQLIRDIQSVPLRKVNIDGRLYHRGSGVYFEVTDGLHTVTVQSDTEAIQATSPNIHERLLEQLQKTGETGFEFSQIKIEMKDLFLPIKTINQMRRDALQQLFEKRIARPSKTYGHYQVQSLIMDQSNDLFVKVRTKTQLEQAIALGIKHIILEEPIVISTTEHKNIHFYQMPKRIRFHSSNEKPTISSIYQNVFNSYTLYFWHQQGIRLVGLSLELSKSEIKTLIEHYQRRYQQEPNAMMMVYGYAQLMIMKHCIKKKQDKDACITCNQENAILEDRLGYRFPLIQDGSCNTILLNSRRLHLLDEISAIKQTGVHALLLDFTIETDIEIIWRAYADAFYHNASDSLKLDDATKGHYREGVM